MMFHEFHSVLAWLVEFYDLLYDGMLSLSLRKNSSIQFII